MTEKIVGKLEKVEVRSVYENEARDFTPWLNENIGLLGDILGLNIIENRIEENVGSFSCDIVAKDSNSEKKIVIENQFGDTNHDHLGKIFTYAAGTGASIVIWVSETFREEHKKALEWLNENSDPESGLSFFGVEIRLVRIGGSPAALDFNVIVKPNDWERNIRIAGKSGGARQAKYLKFFSQLCDQWNKLRRNGLREVKPSANYFMILRSGIPGLRFAWVFSWEKFIVELVVELEKEKSDKLYEAINSNIIEIEKRIGPILFDKKEGIKKWKVYVNTTMRGTITILKDEEFLEIINWGVKTMNDFTDVLSSYLHKYAR